MGIRVLWCDADGNLFPSEEPAYVASAQVTNDFLATMGLRARYTPEELRRRHTGKNFRTTAAALCREHGVDLLPGQLEEWVRREADAVTAYLERTLQPDPAVLGPVRALADRYRLCLVSSSAARRLDACLRVTGLAEYFTPQFRFSAEDSLPVPRGKPDPAIYRHAAERLGVAPEEGVAVEDSAVGVQSAVAAGFTTVGNVQFVADPERPARAAALTAAGAGHLVDAWAQVPAALAALRRPDDAVAISPAV